MPNINLDEMSLDDLIKVYVKTPEFLEKCRTKIAHIAYLEVLLRQNIRHLGEGLQKYKRETGKDLFDDDLSAEPCTAPYFPCSEGCCL